MKNWPTDPMRQNDRLIANVCLDWLEAGTVTRNTPRADAMCEINRQIREGDCAKRTVATQASPRAGSRLGHSVSVNYRKGEGE